MPAPTPTAEIIAFLDELLEVERFADYGPNGIQVPGARETSTIVTGVSATAELFERAIGDHHADLILTHLGILWDGHPRRIGAQLAHRLKLLLTNDVALAAYHLPLDAHLTHGNNALLAQRLHATDVRPAFRAKGNPIGVTARFPGDGIAPTELVSRVAALTNQTPLTFETGPPTIRTIGIVSGNGNPALADAIGLGLDAFLTGEPTEWAMADAREGEIHYLAAGHYATETFGIRSIGELAAERFGVQHRFVAVPNPI